MKRVLLVASLMMVGCLGDITGEAHPVSAPEDQAAFEAACSQYFDKYRPELAPREFPMDIVIDSATNNSDVSLVLDAIDAWNQRVGVEVLYATITDNINMHGMCNFSTLSTTAVPTDNNWIGLAVYGPCAANMIYVETMNTVGSYESTTFYTDLVVKQIAMHELGHVLGLDHETNQKSVMFESIGNDVRVITEQSKCLVLKAVHNSRL